MSGSGRGRPLVLLWLNEADRYLRAAADAGLTQSIDLATVAAGQRPAAELLSRAEGVLAWSLPAGIIPAMPKLRWIQTMSAGVESWLARSDLDPRIELTCARGVHYEQMPDNILAAIYYVAKPLEQARRQQERCEWARLVPEPLAGKTLAIIGLGTIGADLAYKASVLGMRVVGVKRSPARVPGVEAVHTLAELDRVLAGADFVVLLLPVTPATENIIDARALRHMKKSAWLFNFARGALVVDADLIAAAENAVIAGAVLDVFRLEPLPSDHPFWRTKNIVVLPHIGGAHPDRDRFVAALFVENARRLAEGRPLQALVDRTRGY
ncbi:MAG TPA: D-2-hydroxyacid dehydrogenase [Xanthobacteraceae bacterium]